MTGEFETARRRSWPLILIGLIFAVLSLAVLGLLAAWLLIPKQSAATALFRVSRGRPSILENDATPQYDKQEYEIFKKTQLAALRSYYVLQSSMRKPGIASLSTFAGEDDPVDWLSENLEVEYPENGEYLAISLEGSESQMDDFIRIVDAVAQAYSDEVVFKDRAIQLGSTDLLSRSLESLNKEIIEKSQLMLEIAKDSGIHDEATAAALRQLNLDRLERVELELMRLEGEQLKLVGGDEEVNSKFYESRIPQLRERQAELEKQLVQGTEASVELDVRKAEIEQLQQTANELAIKLQLLDIERNAPARIELVQRAAVSPAD